MIYWLSGSLVILVLVTVMLTPESSQSPDVDVEKAANIERAITTGATNNPAQSLNASSEKIQADGGLKTTDSDTENVGILVDSESSRDDFYGNQAKKRALMGLKQCEFYLYLTKKQLFLGQVLAWRLHESTN